jgi:hypothetical protein
MRVVRHARTILAGVLGASVAAALACNAITGAADLETAECLDCGDGGPVRQLPPPACACHPAAPDGWRGPLALLETGGDAPAPSCPGLVVAFEGGLDPAAPAACTPCTCGAPSVTCTMTTTMLGEPTCVANSSCGKTTVAPGACARISYCSPSGGATIAATPADGGSCAPDGGVPVPIAWGKQAVGCAAPAPDPSCGAGQACSPTLSGSRVCVAQAGDVPCPPGPYQSRIVYHASVKDDRACAACTCDPPKDVQCAGGAVTVYSDTSCTANPQSVSGAGCNPVTANAPAGGAKITTPPASDGGSCAPKGGEPLDGGVAPAEPTTVCCLP